MKTFTRADVISWQPCHGEVETLQIMEGLPEQMNALDVLRHEAAKPADRLWCVLRSGVLSDRTMRSFAAWCARTVLDTMRAAGREPDPRSCAAVKVAERYALGKATEGELRDAYAAACDGVDAVDADDAAAYHAARAARAAAHAAASADAAYAAARAAFRAAFAAVDAADAAAYDAVRVAQVERLIQIIEEGEK